MMFEANLEMTHHLRDNFGQLKQTDILAEADTRATAELKPQLVSTQSKGSMGLFMNRKI
jgi:hypothetical protein